jgi:hypothetical protein
MDDRNERGCGTSEAFEHGVMPAKTSGPDAPEAYDPETDPVLKALRAAPWVQLSEEEEAELQELEEVMNTTQRWIPASEFMADLETWCAQQAAIERENVAG